MAKKFIWKPVSITPTKAGKKTKIHIPQPDFRPLQLSKRDVVRWGEVNLEPDWFTLHKRGPRRPKVGEDPLEARAVPHGYIRGTLPERIVYYYLTKYLKFQSGVDFDFQCLAGHHKVITKDLRWVQIKDLKVGDELLTFEESGPRRKFSRGVVIHNEPFLSEAMDVLLSDGSVVRCTPEHPWIVYGHLNDGHGTVMRWMETRELKPGRKHLVS